MIGAYFARAMENLIFQKARLHRKTDAALAALIAGPSVCLGQMKSNTEAIFCLKVGDSPAENA